MVIGYSSEGQYDPKRDILFTDSASIMGYSNEGQYDPSRDILLT